MTVDISYLNPSPQNESPRRPKISVVIPVFGHSGLVREAMFSLARQPDFPEIDVVIVDDGCPDPQTYITLTSFSAKWSNVHYIRQINSGLSAARNTAIEFVIRFLKESEAIFFLDADNFLESYSILSMQNALLSHVEVDWFYPDIRMFGLRRFNDYSGSYMTYGQAVVNICEAGSLIRRRVIESDLRFDESMRLGYEDWDFWLSAVERGFRGLHLPALGLSYRKRAESMLADSQRFNDQIQEYMRQKHEKIYQIGSFVRLEHEDLPRFALILSDCAAVEMATDVQIGGTRMGRDLFVKKIWEAIREPTFVSAGEYILMTSSQTLEILCKYGLIRWISIEIEQALCSHNFISLNIKASEDNAFRVHRHNGSHGRSHMFGVTRNLMHAIAIDPGDSWISGLLEGDESYNIACVDVFLPTCVIDSVPSIDQASSEFVQFCFDMRRSHTRGRPTNIVEDVYLDSRPLDAMMLRARSHYGNAMLPPVAAPRQGRIAFVLPHCDFGGVEKVTFCLSRELRRLGFSTSLVLLGDDVIYRASHAVEAFDDIYIMSVRDKISAWSGSSFLGTRTPSILNNQWAREAVNFLQTFELVISCHSAEILELFSKLRRHNVLTATYLHLFDKSEIGAFCGHPALALAYEHAIDLVLTCSNVLAAEMTGLGVPRTKILALPNAPSLHPKNTNQSLARSSTDRPIRVLYLGRLDAQKGLDRLASIVDLIGYDINYDVRIIGKSVLTHGELPLNRHIHLIEPPLYDDDSLSAVYGWADVLILPSRYEGLPLTVLEAMAHGVVPVVADCGAVTEIVDTGVNGYVVQQHRCIEGFIEHLKTLEANRQQLEAMSSAALRSVASRPWSILAEQMVTRFEALRAARSKSKNARAAIRASA